MNQSLLAKLDWSEDDAESASIATLCDRLADEDGQADLAGTWPEALWGLT